MRKIDEGGIRGEMKDNAVLQEWVCQLSWKKQTVMLGTIRSPDVPFSVEFKSITTWLRANILENADPVTAFMRSPLLPRFDHVEREFERLPLHSAHHILLAMQTISFEHPDQLVRYVAEEWHRTAVLYQHMNPETRAQYEARYTDAPDRDKRVSFAVGEEG